MALPSAEPWYLDPRWWGIVVSTLIGLSSIVLQAFYRVRDGVKKERDERFETDIAEEIRACFPNLRKVVNGVTRIADKEDLEERKRLAFELTDGDCRVLVNDLWSICKIADSRTKQNGELFVDIAAEWEDVFNVPFPVACTDADLSRRKAAAVEIRKGADNIQIKLRCLLDKHRKNYRC